MTSNKSSAKEKIHYEFGGPIGTFFVIIGLPIVIYGLFFLCNDHICLTDPTAFDWSAWLNSLPSFQNLFTWEATVIYLGWMVFHTVLERILPGEVVEGVVLPDNKSKLRYKMSGHLQFWLCLIAMGHAYPIFSSFEKGNGWCTGVFDSWNSVFVIHGFKPLDLSLVYDQYLPLISISIVFTFLFSVYLYVTSFLPSGKILAKGGNTGNVVYDFFIGRELNPRIGTLDLKEFCELRPGLIGWAVINLGMAFKQYQKRKLVTGVGSISISMFLITLLQGFYVWDALYMEKAILTTMDITTDGFGFMLCFGDLSWVPFIYSLQARYLVDYDPEMSLVEIVVIFSIYLLGFYVFRSANSQKDAFRTNPLSDEVKHLKFMETKRGTKLLTSGWWGMARKINYTGDWLITFSWCLLCGFKSPIPYFQAIYFLVLLIHRAIRDDELCHEKYGDDWLEYKKRVPYMFIPYII